jgi:hypothetical protein
MSAAVTARIERSIPRLVAVYALLFRVANKALWPFAEVALRLWLAQRFFGLGMMNLMTPNRRRNNDRRALNAIPALLLQ